MPKPGDFFLGLYEFFSILVPGALLLVSMTILSSKQVFAVDLSTVSNWADFLLLSYLVGHFLQVPADVIDKQIYNRLYVKSWKRRKPDRLLDYATNLVKQTGRDSYGNIYDWAYATVRVSSDEATLEIDRLQADSKLFRSVAIVFLIITLMELSNESYFYAVLLFLLSLLSLFRYAYLRWKAVCFLYRYFILFVEATPVSGKYIQFWPSSPNTGDVHQNTRSPTASLQPASIHGP